MGLHGDPLAIFLAVLLFLLTAVLACIIGALTCRPSWERTVLWIGAGVFTVASIAWFADPKATPLVDALFKSGAPLMLVTVGVVALMQGGRRRSQALAPTVGPPKLKRRPAEAYSSEKSSWLPDTTLAGGVEHLAKRIAKGDLDGAKVVCRKAILEKLIAGELCAWATSLPNKGEEYQVNRYVWDGAQINWETSYAFIPSGSATDYSAVPLHSIRLSLEQFKVVWPNV